ncbi:hypothetical protein J7F04_23935 [Streptomyces sp. ISL-24]|nr:hypothetical protein [Streptomyces sp. ISL-24]
MPYAPIGDALLARKVDELSTTTARPSKRHRVIAASTSSATPAPTAIVAISSPVASAGQHRFDHVRLPGRHAQQNKPQVADLGFHMERVTRIELALSAWEATALVRRIAADLRGFIVEGLLRGPDRTAVDVVARSYGHG